MVLWSLVELLVSLFIQVCNYGLADTNWSHLVNIEVLSEEGPLLRGRLPAVVGQDLFEGCYSVLWLAEREGLATDCEVDVVLCQRPGPPLVHLHGLAVAAQRVPPLHEQVTRDKQVVRYRRKRGAERGEPQEEYQDLL